MDDGDDHDHGDDHGHDHDDGGRSDPASATDRGRAHRHDPIPDTAQRTTAPMAPFTTREAGIGAVVALVGALLAFGVPLLLA
jgi:hypothetical protein